MKDLRKSNKWVNLRKKYRGPFEREVLDYFELLESQIVSLDAMVNALNSKEKEAEDEDQCD